MTQVAFASDVFEEFSKPLEYLIDGAAAKAAPGTAATANVATMADAVARLASRRFEMEIIGATILFAVPAAAV